MNLAEVAGSTAVLVAAARAVMLLRRGEEKERAAFRVLLAGGAGGAIAVGICIAISFVLLKRWDGAGDFYGAWLSDPTFVGLSGASWALGGLIGISEAWKPTKAVAQPPPPP